MRVMALTLSYYLARERFRAGVKQKDFAAKAGITQGYLSDIAKGKRRPGPDVARKISAATGGKVKLETLLFGDCP